MELDEAIDVVSQRRDYLTKRARIKAEQGWENVYDLRERDAHATILAAVDAAR